MDGLECNEVFLSEIGSWNPILRIDAEFFNKEAVRIDDEIRGRSHYHISREQVVSGPFGSTLKSEAYLTSGDVPFVRIENIRGGFYINSNEMVYISNHDNERIKNSELFMDDIVLSKVGNTIGFFARVDERLLFCNISENNIGIKMSKYPSAQRKFILAYLNSRYAQILIQRRTSGNAQPKLNVGDVCLIPIPSFSNELYSVVANLIDKSEAIIVRSEELYRSAERILSDELNIQKVEQTIPVTATKLLSKSFMQSGRLDAEYYQPKYKVITHEINTAETVSTLCNIYDDVFVPQADIDYPYIELANVGCNGDISDVELEKGGDLPSRARRRVAKGQVIISSVEGSLESCALIEDDYDGALCSTGFYVLDSDTINSETLLVLFKSEPIQALLKQRCSGTILTAIGKDELLSMPLPKIDPDVQKAIAEKVQESFALRRKSQELLEYAKQAVEMAIEQGEDVALEWIKAKA